MQIHDQDGEEYWVSLPGYELRKWVAEACIPQQALETWRQTRAPLPIPTSLNTAPPTQLLAPDAYSVEAPHSHSLSSSSAGSTLALPEKLLVEWLHKDILMLRRRQNIITERYAHSRAAQEARLAELENALDNVNQRLSLAQQALASVEDQVHQCESRLQELQGQEENTLVSLKSLAQERDAAAQESSRDLVVIQQDKATLEITQAQFQQSKVQWERTVEADRKMWRQMSGPFRLGASNGCKPLLSRSWHGLWRW